MSAMVLRGQIIRVSRLGNTVRSVKISASNGTRKFHIVIISSVLLSSIPKVCLRLNQKVELVVDAQAKHVHTIRALPADRSTAPDYREMNTKPFLKRLFKRFLP
jgi:hypothetical protein